MDYIDAFKILFKFFTTKIITKLITEFFYVSHQKVLMQIIKNNRNRYLRL